MHSRISGHVSIVMMLSFMLRISWSLLMQGSYSVWINILSICVCVASVVTGSLLCKALGWACI